MYYDTRYALNNELFALHIFQNDDIFVFNVAIEKESKCDMAFEQQTQVHVYF